MEPVILWRKVIVDELGLLIGPTVFLLSTIPQKYTFDGRREVLSRHYQQCHRGRQTDTSCYVSVCGVVLYKARMKGLADTSHFLLF